MVTTAIEHAAVLDSARFVASLGCPLNLVGVDRAGIVSPAEVADAGLTRHRPGLGDGG